MPREKKKKAIALGDQGCSGFLCDWAMTRGSFQCVDGDGGCEGAVFSEADESYFHPKELVEATKKINRILSKIPKDPEGRNLSFCHTHVGILLAWCQHSGKPRPKDAVTRHDSPEKVAKALKLKPKK
jgi:hypothetical protein